MLESEGAWLDWFGELALQQWHSYSISCPFLEM